MPATAAGLRAAWLQVPAWSPVVVCWVIAALPPLRRPLVTPGSPGSTSMPGTVAPGQRLERHCPQEKRHRSAGVAGGRIGPWCQLRCMRAVGAEMARQRHHLVVGRGHMSGVAVPVPAQGGSELRSSLVGEEQARAADFDYLVCAGNGVA